jgi:hypothetical protein
MTSTSVAWIRWRLNRHLVGGDAELVYTLMEVCVMAYTGHDRG